MRSTDIHPGWEVLIYLTVLIIGVAFISLGSSDPATTCTVIT